MPIEIEEFKTAALPGIKCPDVGDGFQIMVAYHQQEQRRVFGKDELLFKKDGKPSMQDIVAGVVVAGKGATIKDGDGEREVVPGDRVRLFVTSYRRMTLWNAVRDQGVPFGKHALLGWRRLDDEKGEGAHDIKCYNATLNRPDDSHEVWLEAIAEMCAEAEKAGPPVIEQFDDGPPIDESQNPQYDYDEEPF